MTTTTSFVPALDADLNVVASALRQTTVVVRSLDSSDRHVRCGHGSGIIWSADGMIITNAHVATTERAAVTFADGRTTQAVVRAHDRRRDLAVLQTDANSLTFGTLPAAAIGSPSSLRPGAVVVALGHPLGVEHSLSLGVVHAVPRDEHSRYIVADIRLAPGNSGGPLADAQGRIVGVNSMVVGGLGIAISSDVVRRFIASVIPRPALGVGLRPVRVRDTSGDRTVSPALLVLTVEQHGAAADAGILQGDLLLGVRGKPLASGNEMIEALHTAGPGGTLQLDVGRAGKRMRCDIVLPPLSGRSRRAA